MSYFEKEVRARHAQGHSHGDIAAALRCSFERIERALLGEYVVRVIHTYMGDDVLYMLQCLSEGAVIKIHRNSDDGICFDILPPDSVDSKDWSTELAVALQLKSMTAVSAPRWPDE